jgi:adenine specific DNA methylase Mod
MTKCREIIEDKREDTLKCIQRITGANQEEYNRKRIAADRVCRRKKREVLKRKADEIDHTKNESKKYYKRIQEITQKFKSRVNECTHTDGKILTKKRISREDGKNNLKVC